MVSAIKSRHFNRNFLPVLAGGDDAGDAGGFGDHHGPGALRTFPESANIVPS